MDGITIPVLNERAYSALAQRLGDPSARLHGILVRCPKPGLLQVLWPYGEVLAALEANYRPRCDDLFHKGKFSLHDFLSCYLRSCQLLGFSIRRFEQKMEDDRREREAYLRGEASWSVEIDIESSYGWFHASVDVAVHLDSCISYLKILADGVAKTIPSVFGAPPFPVSRESMNKLWNDALQQAGSPLGRVFSSTSRAWFDILSAARSKVAGIRDARIHHGAMNLPVGQSVGAGPISVLIQQWSVGKEQVGHLPGETFRDAVVHSRDAISDVVASTFGFFSFMDHVVREAAAQNSALSPVRKAYSKLGYVLAYGPSDFLSSVLPTL
jgi:hypothetical protein